jgi:hypothetical protein
VYCGTDGDAGAHADTLPCRVGDAIRGAVPGSVPDRLEPDLVGGCVVTRGVTRFIAIDADLPVASRLSLIGGLSRTDANSGADTDA